jgi:hypothetical protein
MATELNNFFKRRNSNGQKTHEQMLIISGHKRNQNHAKIPSHSCWNSHHEKHHHQQVLVRMWGKK